MRSLQIWSLLALIVLVAGCRKVEKAKVSPEQSKLQSANQVFWALDELGYMVTKQSANPTHHDCKPGEYLAKKNDAVFRITVLDCADPAKAKALVEDPKTKHVDALLRNHGEGGIFQRGPLQIIVRRTHGDREASEKLLRELQAK